MTDGRLTRALNIDEMNFIAFMKRAGSNSELGARREGTSVSVVGELSRSSYRSRFSSATCLHGVKEDGRL